jgi:hypothetical protein
LRHVKSHDSELNRREFIAAAALSISTPLVAEAQRSALLTGSVGQIADFTIEFHTVGGVV